MDQYRALHILQPHNLRKALKDTIENDSVLFGAVVGIHSVQVAKAVGLLQPDWVFLDAEHSPYSPTLLNDMIQTLKMYSEGRTIPIVRIPEGGYDWAAWALDAGAAGIILPHTETAEQVRAAVRACKFPPQGQRSFPPFIMRFDGVQNAAPEGKTWTDVANDHIIIIPQIESGKGAENIEEILQVEGVEACMIGPMDLQMDLGGDAKKAEEAKARIEEMARKYNKPLCGFAFEHTLLQQAKSGYRMMASAIDFWILTDGIEKALKRSKEILAEGKAAAASAKANGENGHANGNTEQ